MPVGAAFSVRTVEPAAKERVEHDNYNHSPTMATFTDPLVFDPALIRRFDINGPRYTSYPTADRFGPEFDADAYLAANPQTAAQATQVVREVKVSVAEDFNRNATEQAVAVFAPSGPFAAPPPAPPLSPSLREEYEEDSGTSTGQDTRQRKIKIAAGLAAALLLLWLIL